MEAGANPKSESVFLNVYCDDSSVDSICRVCLEKGQDDRHMYSIFEREQLQLQIDSMIMSCAAVQIIEGDGLPKLICQKCMTKLNVAWQFKTQCEMSDAKLRHFYSSQEPLAPTIEEFGETVKEQMEEQKRDGHCEFTYEIHTSPEVKSIADERRPEDDAERRSDNESKSKLKKKTGKTKAADKRREQKTHQCDTCGKTFNRKEYLTQHIRIHTGEKPYRCHLCEKRFINSGHLTTHMRKHTGERPHACQQCPKAFSTRQELQKHTMVHNGDRPFLCKMCGKRFGSSSNLYSHLKHHTGEKNFTCEHCGKAFYTKQELKQHQVVHTGEKAFVCEFCDKRFSQIAHLRRHSKLHDGGVVI